MKRLVTACLALAAALVPAAAAHAQAVPPGSIATLDRPTPVAAFGGVLVWSARDPATGAWALVSRAGGVTRPLPVAQRRVPFDADLGPGPDGAVVAVYSRCDREPPLGSGFAPTLYNRGRGCDLFLFDFATSTERRLANASAPDASEFFPTIWRGTLAFGRVYNDKPDLPYVYTRPVLGTAPSTRQPGGARNACRRDPRSGRTSCSPATQSRPMSLELWGRRLAFAWTFSGFAEGLDTEIRMDTIGGGHTLVARQSGGGLTQVQLGWPAFENGRLYWSASCFGEPEGCPGRFGLRRMRITTREVERAPSLAAIVAHERAGGVTYLLTDAQPGADCLGDPAVPGGTCTLAAMAPGFA
jgi:opacity protein-like surface antigen